MKKILTFSIYTSIFLIMIIILYFYLNQKKEPVTQIEKKIEEENFSSNIINGVNYSSQDTKGNRYIIDAEKGEIDIANSNIIFLTNVKALIKMNNSENIIVTSDFGKYNIDNYDTIFSKNVIIKYLQNKITGDYADFSIGRNSMIISKDVVYTNPENILKSDAISINIETKDTKIYMYEGNKKVNIKSLN